MSKKKKKEIVINENYVEIGFYILSWFIMVLVLVSAKYDKWLIAFILQFFQIPVNWMTMQYSIKRFSKFIKWMANK